MKNYKNYLIAILAGLLVLSFTTQPSQGAGTSGAAKAIQYDHCLSVLDAAMPEYFYFDAHLKSCEKYKP